MRFSPEQLKFMRERFEKNKHALDHKPSVGYGTLIIENNILNLLMGIHNAGVNDDKS